MNSVHTIRGLWNISGDPYYELLTWLMMIINDEAKNWRFTEISPNHQIKSFINNTHYMVYESICSSYITLLQLSTSVLTSIAKCFLLESWAISSTDVQIFLTNRGHTLHYSTVNSPPWIFHLTTCLLSAYT